MNIRLSNIKSSFMKKNYFGRLAALAVAGLTSLSVLAVPALQSEIEFMQADGSTVRGNLHGDEFFSYRTTDEGYVMVENEDGYYEYADPSSAQLVPSGHRVGESELRGTNSFKSTLTKGLTASQAAAAQKTIADNRARQAEIMKNVTPAPTIISEETTDGSQLRAAAHSGDRRFLIILVEFEDKSFSTSWGDFNNLLNTDGYSVASFYKASSWNSFRPVYDVYGPVRVAMTSSYAKDNTADMVVRACELVENAGCDFTQYDTDGDGVVDNVYCFFAGYDRAQGGGNDCIWSHASNVDWKWSYYPDGKKIAGYGCSSELKGNSGANRVNIGTFTHEFGHVIGLPDYYDVNGDTDGKGHTPGNWDCMAGGCYLNDSRNPPLFNIASRELLGWCSIPTIGQGSQTLPDVQSDRNNPGYKIYTGVDGEYFVFEYRKKEGFNSYLPANGALLWHVDRSGSVINWWYNNTPNSHGDHPCMDVVEASGSNTSGGDAWWDYRVMYPHGSNAFDAWSWYNGKVCSVNSIVNYDTHATFNCGEGGSGGGGTDPQPSCQTTDAPVAWFYQDSNYGGTEIALPEGSFNTSAMNSYCLPDNWLSSLKVLPGYKVICYVDDNFGGSSYTWTSSTTYVGADWNDKISSIKIVPNGQTGLGGLWKIRNKNSNLFWDCDGNSTAENAKVVQWTDEGEEAYQQWEIQEFEAGVYHIRPASNLNTKCEVYYGNKDNNTGILMYPQTAEYANSQFIFYKDGDSYQIIARHCGKPLELTGASTEAGVQITIYDNNGSDCQHWYLERCAASDEGHQVATIYADCNYQGTAVGLPEGEYTTWQLRLYGIGDKNLSSLKVKPGYKVTLFKADNFSGDNKSYTSNVDCLVNDGYNDQVSSIRIEASGVSGLSGKYKIKGYNSNLYWNIKNYSSARGAALEQKTESPLSSQDFRLEEIDNTGVYYIRNLNSGLLVDVEGGNGATANRTAISQYVHVYGNKNQRFIAVSKGDNNYQFVARHCGKVIEVPDNTKNDGDALKTWDNNDQKCSYWKLEAIGDYQTDLTDNGGYMSVSHTAVKEGENEKKLIDNSSASKYCATVPASDQVWVQYNSKQSARLTSYTITSANDFEARDPKNWVLQGSNDNKTWEDIDTRSGEVFSERFLRKGYPVSTTKSYGRFRLLVTQRNGADMDGFQISEIQLFGEVTGSFDISTGVEVADAVKVVVYPNPTSDYVNIEGVVDGTQIVVVDMTGRMVAETVAESGAATVDLTGCTRGVYIVRAGNNAVRVIKR